jgi:serine/threonine protein phosphatase PrpC
MLIKAVADTRDTGSSTCVLVQIDEKKSIIYTTNIGDSGYLILRKEGTNLLQMFRSIEQ